MFRIAQEAIVNVERHADARHVTIIVDVRRQRRPSSTSPTTAWASRSAGPAASTPTACSACASGRPASAPRSTSSPSRATAPASAATCPDADAAAGSTA